MAKHIRHVKAVGIHGRFDLEMDFDAGVNIVYGSNGTGKTTLLHILANAVNFDFPRFAYLVFNEIEVILSDATRIQINREQSPNEAQEVEVAASINGTLIGKLARADLGRGRKSEAFREFSTQAKRYRRRYSEELNATYFPAFRTMIEAWSSVDEEDLRIREMRNYRSHLDVFEREMFLSRAQRDPNASRATWFARRLFGEFVPAVGYLSPIEIEQGLNREIQDAAFSVARTDQLLLSDAFVEAFEAISYFDADSDKYQAPQEILGNIAALSEQLSKTLEGTSIDAGNVRRGTSTVYERLRNTLNSSSFEWNPEEQNIASRVLLIYERSLQKRLDLQTSAFASVDSYIKSVNQFLENKELVIEPDSRNKRPVVNVRFPDGRTSGLETLSSGERQIVGLLYAASHIGHDGIVLIDEPEISLHIDWQQDLIEAMTNQLPAKQLIVCTHSPVVGAGYEESMIEAKPKPTRMKMGPLSMDNVSVLDLLDEDDIAF